MWEAGLKEFIFTPLVNGGKKLGVLFFDSETEGTYTEGHFPLFEAIANQLAIAVANILANEEILERERETRVLLGISESIASIHGMAELLQVIHQKIKPLFGFDSPGLFIVNQEENYSCDLTVLTPGITNDAINLKAAAVDLPEKVPYRGSNVEQVMQLEGAHLWNWKEAYEQSGMGHPYLPICFEHGLVYAIVCPLKVGGTKIGFICLNATEDRFTPKQLPFFAAIADQVAVAVANILANEEILEREREKTLLLEVSQAIAKIDNKVDLLHSIDALLQPIFHHSDAGVLVADREKKYVVDYHALYADVIPSTPEAQMMNAVAREQGFIRIPLAGSLVEWAMGQPPMLGKLADLLESGYDAPYLSYEIEHGLTHYLCAPLTVSGNTFGFFDLLFREVHQPDVSRLPLFAQITDVIAVALSNILAKEEILEREREKSRLLEISQAIASVQEPKQLLKVIYDTIRLVFPFADAGLFVIDKEVYHRDLVVDEQVLDTTAVTTLTQQEISGRLHRHPAIEYFMAHGPVVRPLAEVYEQFPGHPHYPSIQAAGYQHILGGPLRQGSQTIGMLCFFPQAGRVYTAKDFNLFRAICDQVAVAVANILANEEILEREREKATLLSISEQLATIRDKHDLFTVIFEKLKPVFGFDEAVVVLCDEERQYTRHLHTATNASAKQNEHYQFIMSERVPVAGTPYEEFLFNEVPKIYSYQYLSGQYPHHVGVKILKDFGLLESVFMPLRYGGKVLGTFEFHTAKQGRFSESQMPLFRNVADQVAVAVANILANEEILEREREKSQLLEITELIAQVKGHRRPAPADCG
jgi:GAF domain-containing protein